VFIADIGSWLWWRNDDAYRCADPSRRRRSFKTTTSKTAKKEKWNLRVVRDRRSCWDACRRLTNNELVRWTTRLTTPSNILNKATTLTMTTTSLVTIHFITRYITVACSSDLGRLSIYTHIQAWHIACAEWTTGWRGPGDAFFHCPCTVFSHTLAFLVKILYNTFVQSVFFISSDVSGCLSVRASVVVLVNRLWQCH